MKVNQGNDLKEIVSQAKAGIVVISGVEEVFFKSANTLVKSEEIRNKMGQNGRNLLAEKFSVKSACNQIENVLKPFLKSFKEHLKIIEGGIHKNVNGRSQHRQFKRHHHQI